MLYKVVHCMGLDKYTMYLHRSSLQNSFSCPEIPLGSACSSLLPCFPLATTEPFTVSRVLSLPECHIAGIIQYVAFSDCFLSLSKMHLKFLHVFSWLESSFLFSAEYYSIVWMDHSLSIHLLRDILVASKFWQF